jgi:hypothetical protein
MGTNIKLAGAVGVSSSAPNTSQVTFSVTTATFDLSAGGFTLRFWV